MHPGCQQCHHVRWMLEVIHSDFGYINFPTIILEYRSSCDSSDTVHATIDPHEGYKSPGQEHKMNSTVGLQVHNIQPSNGCMYS